VGGWYDWHDWYEWRSKEDGVLVEWGGCGAEGFWGGEREVGISWLGVGMCAQDVRLGGRWELNVGQGNLRFRVEEPVFLPDVRR